MTKHAARGHEIVEQQHALAGPDRVLVHFHFVDAVFERVGDAHRFVRQLAALANGNEAALQAMRDGATEDEAACFDARDLVDVAIAPGLHQQIDTQRKGPRISQQGGDVAKLDTRLGVVGDRADRLAQKCELGVIHGGRV